MAENTKIEWATHTFNPWMGCTKVSPACKNCYAERDFDHRYNKVKWGKNGTRVVTSESNWRKPLQWNRDQSKYLHLLNENNQGTSDAAEIGPYGIHRPRVFCASLADVFEDWDGQVSHSSGIPMWKMNGLNDHAHQWAAGQTLDDPDSARPLTLDDLRKRLFKLIDATPHLDWLLLTKLPENIKKMWPCKNDSNGDGDCASCKHGVCKYRKNVWLGTSVESQEYADKRVPELLECRDIASVLFLSCEPLLGNVDLEYPKAFYPDGPQMCCSGFECGCMGLPCDPPLCHGIDWIIAGGESGPDARPSHPDWFSSLRRQAASNHIPFLFKQWGEWVPGDHDSVTFSDNEVLPWHDKEGSDITPMVRVGKKRAGRILDGCTHDGFPVVTENV